MRPQQKESVRDAVKKASAAWQAAFNAGDAAACAAHYEEGAVMYARPFGTFTGTKAIQGFWEHLISEGYTDVVYLQPKIDVKDATQAIVRSDWTMNKAKGVIHKEWWVLQSDGTAKLREDDFEALSS